MAFIPVANGMGHRGDMDAILPHRVLEATCPPNSSTVLLARHKRGDLDQRVEWKRQK